MRSVRFVLVAVVSVEVFVELFVVESFVVESVTSVGGGSLFFLGLAMVSEESGVGPC